MRGPFLRKTGPPVPGLTRVGGGGVIICVDEVPRAPPFPSRSRPTTVRQGNYSVQGNGGIKKTPLPLKNRTEHSGATNTPLFECTIAHKACMRDKGQLSTHNAQRTTERHHADRTRTGDACHYLPKLSRRGTAGENSRRIRTSRGVGPSVKTKTTETNSYSAHAP